MKLNLKKGKIKMKKKIVFILSIITLISAFTGCTHKNRENNNKQYVADTTLNNIELTKENLQGQWYSTNSDDAITTVVEFNNDNFLLMYSGLMYANTTYNIENDIIKLNYNDNISDLSVRAFYSTDDKTILNCLLKDDEGDEELILTKINNKSDIISGKYAGYTYDDNYNLGASVELIFDDKTKTGTMRTMFTDNPIKYLVSGNTITITSYDDNEHTFGILSYDEALVYEIKGNDLYLAGNDENGNHQVIRLIHIPD